MSNKLQIKRTTVSGRTPNTTNSANSHYIDTGELAINVLDGRLFSSDGSNLIEFGTGTPVYDEAGNLISNTFVTTRTAALAAVTLDIIPAVDATYSLANTTNRWLTLNVSNTVSVGNSTVNTTITSTSVTANSVSLRSANITYVGANTGYPLTVTSSNTVGGVGYADFLKVTNSSTGASAINKSFRLNSAGTIEIINSAYSAAILGLTDSGNFSTSGTITPGAYTAGQVIKDTILSNSEVTVVSTTIASSGTSTNFITYNYTPVSASSYLIVHIHISKYEHAGTTDDSWYSQLKVDGNEIAYGWQKVNDDNTGTSGRSGVLFPLTGRYTNSNTAVKQIQVAARRDTADDSITIDNSSTAIWLRITEVAR